jgi:hypothetical protein
MTLLETFEKLDISTKHEIAEITSAKLLALTALEIAETKCNVDRLTAEHIVACLEAAGVDVKKISIIRALASSSGFVSTTNVEGESYYKLMTKGKRAIENILDNKKMSIVRVEQNQPRTARLELSELFQSVKGTVRICDPYYGVRTLDLLEKFPKTTKVLFISSQTNESGRRLEGALKDFKIERPNIYIKLLGKSQVYMTDMF